MYDLYSFINGKYSRVRRVLNCRFIVNRDSRRVSHETGSKGTSRDTRVFIHIYILYILRGDQDRGPGRTIPKSGSVSNGFVVISETDLYFDSISIFMCIIYYVLS